MHLIGFLRNRGVKVCLVLLAIVGMLGIVPQASADAGNNNVKIVALFGAGNLSKSEYGRDTIILFNPTSQDIDMTGWTVQIGGATGSFSGIYSMYALPLASPPVPIAHPIIKAGGYFAIAASGVGYTSGSACNTTHCFLADANYDAQLGTATTLPTLTQNTISSTATVVAISSGSATLGSTCALATANKNLVDLLGIEAADGPGVAYTTTSSTPTVATTATTVSCYAGGGPSAYTPSPLNYFTGNPAQLGYPTATSTTYVHGTTYAFATVRKNRCVDTFNNYADFTQGYIGTNPTLAGNVFLNSQTPVQPCPAGNQMTVVPQASPENPAPNATFTVSAKVIPASGRTIANVQVDTSELSSGTNSATYVAPNWVTMTAGANNTYTTTLTMPSVALTANKGQLLGLNVVATDSAGDTMSSAVQMGSGVTVPGPGNHDLVITGFYGGGSLTNSQYSRDTIILFNPTQNSIDVSKYMLISGGTTGAFGVSTTAYTAASSYHIGNINGGSTIIPPGGYYAIAASGNNLATSTAHCSSTYAASPCNNGYAYDYQLGVIEGPLLSPPAPVNQTTQNILSSTQTIYALINNSATPTAVTTYPPGTTCPLHSPRITDMISNATLGIAQNVSCWPGTDSAHVIPNSYNGAPTLINGVALPFATIRGNPCGNMYDEAVDFQLGYIDFENSQSTPRPCPVGQPLLISATASPSSLGLSDNLTITATLTPASNSSTDMVTGDFSIVGAGSAVNLANSPAGSNTYTTTIKTATTSGFNIGLTGVVVPGIQITATDTANNKASTSVPITIIPGTIILTSTKSSITVKSGGIAVFPLTLQSLHGYAGIVTISCTGSPNANALGLPVGMQCVTTPPEITLPVNGSTPCQLGISAGTTYSAGVLPRSFYAIFASLLSLMVLGVGFWRRKHLPAALALALLALVSIGTMGCETNAGMNTGAAPGTYTFVVTAADTDTPTVINSTVILTVVVQ